MRWCLLVLLPLLGCDDLEASDPVPVDPGVDARVMPDPAPATDGETPPDPVDAAPVDAAEPAPDAAGGCPDDADGDGYGRSAQCGAIDCDDANAAIHPGAFEACNGADDDCDGTVDEGLNTAICGVGACRVEVPNCQDGRPQRCQPGEPLSETCNGVDDDCDGTVDEDGAPESCGVGACERAGACDRECVPGDPSPEVCNGIDDDCNGTVDDGFRAEVVNTAYSTLITRHEVCNGGGERIGPNCNAAMNRFCADRDCSTTGFGPVENSGDTSVVTCVRAAMTQRVPYATLATHHDGCDGNRERIGPTCNAAIHRYCASRGFVSGFGPLESGADFVWVACMGDSAVTVGTRYSVLTGHHPPCDGQNQRIGPDCNAAIHRWCRSQGHVSGFGPVENVADDLAVVCVGR